MEFVNKYGDLNLFYDLEKQKGSANPTKMKLLVQSFTVL